MKPFTKSKRLWSELERLLWEYGGRFYQMDVDNLKKTIREIDESLFRDGVWKIENDDEVEDNSLTLTMTDKNVLGYFCIYFKNGEVGCFGMSEGVGYIIDAQHQSDEDDYIKSLECDPEKFSLEAVERILEKIHDYRISLYKKFFQEILKLTQRKNIEHVLDCLERTGFFMAPASRHDHLCFRGGLLIHSVKTYNLANEIARSVIGLAENLESDKDRDARMPRVFGVSVAIAALLHDVCKAQRYTLNSDGTYGKCYGVSVGHGEGSVIWLLSHGLELTHAEQLAIRYHMGGYDVSGAEEARMDLKHAMENYPLVTVIQAADTLSSSCLE